MYDQRDNALIVRRPESPRLVLFFSGRGLRFPLGKPLEFLRNSGIDDQNVVFLWDSRDTGFVHGCSERIDGFDALLAWLDDLRAPFTHVREIVCVGISSGALASMAAAEHLRAARSVAFGPRHHPLALSTLPERGTPIRLTTLDRALQAAYAGECHVRRLIGLPGREWFPPALVHAALEDAVPIAKRVGRSRATIHHVYYVPSNVPDRTFIAFLRRHGIPFVEHAVQPAPGYSKRAPGWDHNVVHILVTAGRLRETMAPLVQDVNPSAAPAAQLALMGPR